MTSHQVAVFMEERKWDYRSTFSFNVDFVMQCISVLTAALVFGFAAALLEGLPVIGLLFTLSNRIGAAMWAHGRSFILAVLEMLSLIYRTIQTLKNANTLSQPSGFAIDTPLGQMRIHKHCRPSRTQKLAEIYFPFFAIMLLTHSSYTSTINVEYFRTEVHPKYHFLLSLTFCVSVGNLKSAAPRSNPCDADALKYFR